MKIDVQWQANADPNTMVDTLDRLWNDLESRLEAIIERGVKRIERLAKEKAPVDTGNLRASIESIVEKVALDTIRGEAGTNTEYAPYVELGTRYMDAQPYLRPAFDEVVPDVVEDVKQAVRNAERSL